MRSKLIAAIGAVAIAFLLVTNPVIADAAKQITGKQIKNNTVTTKDIKNNNLKSKDIKNGSLKAADLKAGTIPTEVVAVRRLAFEGSQNLVNGTRVFGGDFATVTVDGNDLVIVDASLNIDHSAANDTVDFGTCIQEVGGLGEPPFLDTVDMFDVQAPNGNENIYAVQGSGTPAAGTYNVGPCVDSFSGVNTVVDAAGTVTVFDGTTAGPLGKAATKGSGGRG